METDREIASGVACGEPMELDRAIEFGDPGALPNGDFGDPGGPLTVARRLTQRGRSSSRPLICEGPRTLSAAGPTASP